MNTQAFLDHIVEYYGSYPTEFARRVVGQRVERIAADDRPHVLAALFRAVSAMYGRPPGVAEIETAHKAVLAEERDREQYNDRARLPALAEELAEGAVPKEIADGFLTEMFAAVTGDSGEGPDEVWHRWERRIRGYEQGETA